MTTSNRPGNYDAEMTQPDVSGPDAFGNGSDLPTPNCNDTLKELQLFLDGELNDDERAHVLQHLDDCLECFHAYDFQAELKQIVAAKCGNDPMPGDLLARLQQVCNGEMPPGDAGPMWTPQRPAD